MKINFLLSKKADVEGKREIILRANKKTTHGKVVTLRAKSRVRTLAEYFDESVGIDVNKRRGVPIEERKFQSEQKKKLDGILHAICEAENNAIEQKIEIKHDWLEKVVSAHMDSNTVESKSKDFYTLMRKYYKDKHFSDIQVKHLQVIMRDVRRYEAYMRFTGKKGHNYKFIPNEVTRQDIEDWLSYLRQEKNILANNPAIANKVMEVQVDGINRGLRDTKERGLNTMIKRANRMKSFFIWLLKNNEIKSNPFDGIEIGVEKYGNVIFPTLEERRKMYATPMPSKKMEIVRDAFVLQSVLGCRIGDLLKLSERNISDGVLNYTPHKTKDETQVTATVPINSLAQEIIEKYRGKDKYGRLMPFPTSQSINKKIKEVFRLAGITRDVEVRDPKTGENVIKSISDCAITHMARRCFIGNAYNEVADPNIIAKMSGHKEGSKSFARYRKIDIDIIKHITDKLV